jgi:hypothetical protein
METMNGDLQVQVNPRYYLHNSIFVIFILILVWHCFIITDESTATRGAYRVGSDNHFEGLRVRLTVTISAAGMMAPIYATVTGLKDSEMPIDLCPSGIVIIEVPGLSCGNVDIRNQQSGYIVFLRQSGHEGKGNTETENFRLYREKVLLPFIDASRVSNGHKSGAEVSDALTAVSWIDGALAQFLGPTKGVRP